ncbi:MAG TPA: acyltransferase [Rhodocyclaceae bacterium]|nr:acyltransferase [Rhodocyclaceae bacterium]
MTDNLIQSEIHAAGSEIGSRPADTTTPRQEWIDIAKGIGIIAVVAIHDFPLAHIQPYLPHLARMLAVPLFFMLSGATLSTRGDTVSKALSRAASLIWVYFTVSLVLAPLYPAAGGISGFLRVLHGNGTTTPNPPLWFLPCLALALPTAALFQKAASGRWTRETIMALALLAVTPLAFAYDHPYEWAGQQARGLPWSLDLVPLAVGFLLIGRVFARFVSSANKRRCLLTILTCIAICGGLLLLPHKPFVDLNTRVFQPLLPAILAAISVPLAVMMLCRLMATHPASRALSSIGRASLPILALHWAVIVFVLRAAERAEYPVSVAAAVALVAGVCIPWGVDLTLRRTLLGAVLFYPRSIRYSGDSNT